MDALGARASRPQRAERRPTIVKRPFRFALGLPKRGLIGVRKPRGGNAVRRAGAALRAGRPRSQAAAPSFPRVPRHSRESGNPDGCSQTRHPKSGTNHRQRIPSPMKGLQG